MNVSIYNKEMKFSQAEEVSYTVDDEWHLLFDVRRYKNGFISARVRVGARVIVEGETYKLDEDIILKMSKEK